MTVPFYINHLLGCISPRCGKSGTDSGTDRSVPYKETSGTDRSVPYKETSGTDWSVPYEALPLSEMQQIRGQFSQEYT